VYTEESQDFRFFKDWFTNCLERYRYETENFIDLYDPLRCPANLLWALADTMGYKFDDRLPVSFNRLVLLYFMSMIRNRGSRDGVTLAAMTNLAQFNILQKARGFTDSNGKIHPPQEIAYDRLEDTSIPANSVYVSVNTSRGYIDVVYFCDRVPLDACIEYVRPVGMYAFQHAGVRFSARSGVAIDARLANTRDVGMSFGPTHVGHYRRRDYASLQLTRQKLDDAEPNYRIVRIPNTDAGKWFIQEFIDDPTTYHDDAMAIAQTTGESAPRRMGWETIFGPFTSEKRATAHFQSNINDKRHNRENVWYRNRENESRGQFGYEPPTSRAPASFRYTINGEEYHEEEFFMNPGYRTLYSLQLCNNEEIVQSLFTEDVFSLGYGPQDFYIRRFDDNYDVYPYRNALGDDTFRTWKYHVDDAERTDRVIDPRGRRDWRTNQPARREINPRGPYNLQYDRDTDESRLEQNFSNYSIEQDQGRWVILLDGERVEPGRSYAELRHAEVRLSIIAPPDLYTVEPRHPSNTARTDAAEFGTPQYDSERMYTPNVTRARPQVGLIMSESGESVIVSPDIDGSLITPRVPPEGFVHPSGNEGNVTDRTVMSRNEFGTEIDKDPGSGKRRPTGRVLRVESDRPDLDGSVVDD